LIHFTRVINSTAILVKQKAHLIKVILTTCHVGAYVLMGDLGNLELTTILSAMLTLLSLEAICKNEPTPKIKDFWCHFENVRLMFFKNEQLNT
jgi:hypothetical protein